MPVLMQMLTSRRRSTFWWSFATAALTAVIVVAYPTVRDNKELDNTFADLPSGLQASFGLGDGLLLTSPVGYLNSQFFANTFPVLLLVLAIGAAAWTVAGDEESGMLEVVLANPVSRARVALERFLGVVIVVTVVSLVGTAALMASSPLVRLDDGLSVTKVIASVVAAALMSLTYASVAFLVGAATGRRSHAIAAAGALALGGFVVQGLSAQVSWLQGVSELIAWHWFLDGAPLLHGLTWQMWVLPLITSTLCVAAGVGVFRTRDLD